MAARKQAVEPELSAAEKEFDVEDKSTPKRDKAGGGVEVELDDDDDDSDDKTPAETPTSRNEKRRQRKAILDENQALRERAEAAERSAQHAAGFAQGLNQQLSRPTQPQEDPLAAEEKSLQAEMDRLVNESNMLERAKGTPEQFADLKKRAWEFDQRKSEFLLRKAGGGRQQAPDPNTNARLMLMARYPDLMSNDQAFYWAQHRYNQALLEGNPNDWTTRDYVADLAREKFGMKPQRRRGNEDNAMRQKLTGTPKGGTGAAEPQTNTVRLSEKQVDEARAAYPHLKEKEALAKYAKGLLRGQRA